MKINYGIMQGRLSPLIGKKIQAFPAKHWKQEFKDIKKIDLNLIEWTLDYKNLNKNPLLTLHGKKEIRTLCKKYSINIHSVTCDCFMEKPFWKIKNNKTILNYLKKIIFSSGELNIKYIIIPLVDKGSINNLKQEKKLISICKEYTKFLQINNTNIIFESDFEPKILAIFIKKFKSKHFGINYDTGNSASLDYDINNEFFNYGKFIRNIHIKDREKFGKTVRLGKGNANFKKLFQNLKKIKYKGNLIMQTARSLKNNHLEELRINLKYIREVQNEI